MGAGAPADDADGVVPSALAAAAGERHLPLAGASNFRDLGGYHGTDGRAVRWRSVFRSDHLGALTPRDLEVIGALGIERTVDFRGVHESAATPDRSWGAAAYALPIEPSVVQDIREMLAAGDTLTPEATAALMRDLYRRFVTASAAQLAQFFRVLLDARGAPLVFHCTAGKDRTGYAAALFLSALGIPRAAVLHDYLLTNRYYRAPIVGVRHTLPREALSVLWSVQDGFLLAALDLIDRDFGGMDAYLSSHLGVGRAERATLARAYLV